MANRKWPTIRVSDAEVFARFKRVYECIGWSPARVGGNVLGSGIGDFEMSSEPSPAMKELLKGNTAAAALYISFYKKNFQLALHRPNESTSDLVEINATAGHDAEEIAAFLACVEREFPAHLRGESVEKILGHELAEFYRAREAALIRLEAVNQRLIEETASYRTRIEEVAAEANRLRMEALASEREQMMLAVASERSAIEARAAEVEAQKKTIDDRAAKYARRGLRESLQAALRAYGDRFALTSETTEKRRIVQALFWLLIVGAGALIATSIAEEWGKDHQWHYYLRIGVGSLTIVGAIVFNIRWADSWFNRLADEELRLKRLGLDIDRASWLVETAMEWQQDYKAPIPDQLLSELSRDLFTSDRSEAVHHPAEDAVGAVLGAASSLKLNIPGVGTAMMNRRGLKSLQEKQSAG